MANAPVSAAIFNMIVPLGVDNKQPMGKSYVPLISLKLRALRCNTLGSGFRGVLLSGRWDALGDGLFCFLLYIPIFTWRQPYVEYTSQRSQAQFV
jgi:hypothetical protein